MRPRPENRPRYRRGRRRPTNGAEGEAFDYLTAQGYDVTKRGWPDFLCRRDDGALLIVEVKKTPEQPFKPDQIRTLRLLLTAGLDCYRYTPELGLESLHLDHPALAPQDDDQRRG